MSEPFTAAQLALLSDGELERYLDAGLRHRSGKTPVDYLRHFLTICRPFAYATQDDSWGELEKELAIVIRRLIVAERDLERFKTVMRTEQKDPTA